MIQQTCESDSHFFFSLLPLSIDLLTFQVSYRRWVNLKAIKRLADTDQLKYTNQSALKVQFLNTHCLAVKIVNEPKGYYLQENDIEQTLLQTTAAGSAIQVYMLFMLLYG